MRGFESSVRAWATGQQRVEGVQGGPQPELKARGSCWLRGSRRLPQRPLQAQLNARCLAPDGPCGSSRRGLLHCSPLRSACGAYAVLLVLHGAPGR